MAIIRWFLGILILSLDWITTPRGIKRDQESQAAIDAETTKLTLYEFNACPFCVKVRRQMKRLSLNIERRDAKRCLVSREELMQGGEKYKVPCLKIKDNNGNITWMYDSASIIDYLTDRFDKSTFDQAETI